MGRHGLGEFTRIKQFIALSGDERNRAVYLGKYRAETGRLALIFENGGTEIREQALGKEADLLLFRAGGRSILAPWSARTVRSWAIAMSSMRVWNQEPPLNKCWSAPHLTTILSACRHAIDRPFRAKDDRAEVSSMDTMNANSYPLSVCFVKAAIAKIPALRRRPIHN